MALIELYTVIGLLSSNWREDVDTKYKWCKNNCSGWWHFDMLSHTTRWNFKYEQDAMAFKLRWL